MKLLFWVLGLAICPPTFCAVFYFGSLSSCCFKSLENAWAWCCLKLPARRPELVFAYELIIAGFCPFSLFKSD